MTARPRRLADLPEQEALALAGAYTLLDPMPTAVVDGCRSLIDAATAEPVPCVTIRYRCPFCRRFSRSRKAAVTDHMTRCWLNPSVRACKTCVHFQSGNRAGIGAYCHDGELCSCGVVEEECLHGDGPDLTAGLRDHCPLWALRGAA